MPSRKDTVNLSDLLTLETAQDKKTTKFTFIKKNTDAVLDNGLLYFALDNTVSIYDASSFAHVKTLSFSNRIRCIDAYEGYLAVGFGILVLEFALVSTNEWDIRYVQTESADLFIDNCGAEVISIYNDRVYYVGRQYWDSIRYYDIKTDESSAVGNSHYSSPYFTIDKKSGILYIAPTGSSSSEITYIDLLSNRLLYEAQFNEYSYNSSPAVFDGTYVHFYGYILDAKTGTRRFDRGRLFPSDPTYEFLGNIYFDNRISVSVAKHDERIVTVVYDTQNKKTAVTAGDAERAIPFGKGFFIIRPNRDTMYYVEL